MLKKVAFAVEVESPVTQALVFICEKCGRRADKKDNASYRLASQIKRSAKQSVGKNGVRAVISPCMKICPDDGIAVTIVPGSESTGRSVHLVADAHDIDATGAYLVERCLSLNSGR